MTLFVVPRETNEAVPFTFALNGTPLLAGVSYALVAAGTRPSTWTAAVTWNANYPCFVVNGQTPGRYKLFAQTTNSSYTIDRYIGDVIVD